MKVAKAVAEDKEGSGGDGEGEGEDGDEEGSNDKTKNFIAGAKMGYKLFKKVTKEEGTEEDDDGGDTVLPLPGNIGDAAKFAVKHQKDISKGFGMLKSALGSGGDADDRRESTGNSSKLKLRLGSDIFTDDSIMTTENHRGSMKKQCPKFRLYW